MTDWIKHTPMAMGECPVPRDAKVAYRLRDESHGYATAGDLAWYECGTATITEFKIDALKPGDPICELGNHVRGHGDVCVMCGATPEQVNEQARAWVDAQKADCPMLQDVHVRKYAPGDLADDYREKTGQFKAAEALTATRKSTHGDWLEQSRHGGELKARLRALPNWPDMSASQQEALDMIATKISRIGCGEPSHADHWDDIAGYAHLGKGGHNSA